MISVNLPIYQAKVRKAQKFNAAPKVGPGFPLGVEPPRASANEPPRKTLTRRSWSVWLVTSSCCALCGDLVATTVRYLESAMRGGGGGGGSLVPGQWHRFFLPPPPQARPFPLFKSPGPGPARAGAASARRTTVRGPRARGAPPVSASRRVVRAPLAGAPTRCPGRRRRLRRRSCCS